MSQPLGISSRPPCAPRASGETLARSERSVPAQNAPPGAGYDDGTRLPLIGRPDDCLMKLSEGRIGHGVALRRPVDGHNRNTIVKGIFDLVAHAVPIPDTTARHTFD
jgi:hypothetical protein